MIKLNLKGKQYQSPSSLADITLREVIGFDEMYGKDLLKFQENSDQEDELDRMELRMDLACKSVSYFAEIPLDIVQKTDLNQILALFQEVISPILEPNTERELQDKYYFKNELWTIASPIVDNKNEMTFIELILGKEITRDLKNLANGKFEALQKLSAVYFRKSRHGKTEEFQEEWMNEDSERVELMAELPMDIVLDVAFFLQSSMSFFLQTSQFLESPTENKKDQI